MEAKVDIRKLQLLNDRINQTIEALNQVRLSVHGLTHSSQIGNNIVGQQMGAIGYGQTVNQVPFVGQMGVPYMSTMQSPYIGLQHTSPTIAPQGVVGQVPWMQPVVIGQPVVTHQGVMGQPVVANHGVMGQPVVANHGAVGSPVVGSPVVVGGLTHTPVIANDVERQVAEVRASDPSRLAQTFPFVFSI